MKVLSLVHPAAIIRGNFGLEAAQILYLKRLRAILEGRASFESVDVEKPPPGALCFPTVEEVQLYFSVHAAHGLDTLIGSFPRGLYACDIEAAGPHIRCIGFCCWHCEKYLQVPFRRQGGRPYWATYTELCRVAEILQILCGDPGFGLIFQNGLSYDIPELEAVFIHVANYAADTLHMQRHAFTEAPANLQYLGITYGRLPAWKRLVKSAEEGEGK